MTYAEARSKRIMWKTLARKFMAPILDEMLSELPEPGTRNKTLEYRDSFYSFTFTGNKNAFSLKKPGHDWHFFGTVGFNSHNTDVIYDIMYSLTRDYDSYTPQLV